MKPKVFIGSSREGRSIADAVHSNLTRDAECTVWHQGIFELSQNTLTALIKVLRNSDFGIFVFSPDDVAVMRGGINQIVRDNVLFELGLFIGRLGQERSFFLVPDNVPNLRLPTDLAGITPGAYEGSRADGNLIAALGPVCSQIRWQMTQQKAFQDIPEPVEVEAPAEVVAPKLKISRKKLSGPSDGTNVEINRYGDRFILAGETMPCKEKLKIMRARWHQDLKGWSIAANQMSLVMHEFPKIKLGDDCK